MKHIFNAITAFLLSAFLALLVSCGDIGTNESTLSGSAYLSIATSGTDSRTIFPETLDFVGDATISFSLSGTSDKNTLEKNWATYAEMTGDTEILLEAGI